jgi:aspartate aminotransferase
MSTPIAPKPNSFRLATRLDNVGFSDIVVIRNKVMELQAAGAQVFQFQGGEPFVNTPDHIKEAMWRAVQENKTRYAPSSGIMELRKALAAKVNEQNGIPAQAADIIVLNGGMQGLFGAFQSVIDPGDEVLVFSPVWTPVKDLTAHCRGKIVYVSTDEARANGFADTLARHTTDKTRAIYYNTPQNPSGVVFNRAEAEAVAQFAQERDLVVIADEAYETLVYDEDHVSIASLPGMFERTISCFTYSKTFSMTGWRLGYAVAAQPWMSGLQRCLLYSTNGVSTPTQWAALAALETPPSYFADLLMQYRERRDLLVGGLNELGLTCEPPAGAFYAFPDVTRVHADSQKAGDILLQQAKVATVPGIVFGPHGDGHLRFSFSTSKETIAAGLDSLRRNL